MKISGIRIRSLYFGTAALMGVVVFVSTCDSQKGKDELSGVVHFSGAKFAGSEACVQCHASIAEAHKHTPHFLTSRPGSAEFVKGNFDSANNVFSLNERLKVIVERTATGIFQNAVVDGKQVDRKPIDITLGSGRQGQTYLFWQENSLFQLPVSYHSASGAWTNSPGYPSDQIVFNRNVGARCLECHSTYFKIGRMEKGNETFDRRQVMLGVDCERCHGPAGDHVIFHRSNPDEKVAQHIVNPARLTRRQRLDNCALCHSGIRNNLMPSFSFVVGNKLDDYFFPMNPAGSASTMDVHGNQFGLLAASKCFLNSEMDCSSCHNVHVRESKSLEVFSQRCMTCHQPEGEHFCKQPEAPGLDLSRNCIDCHMPALPSRQVFIRSPENFQSTPFLVRTHLVGNYEEQVKLFLERIASREGSH